MPDTPHGAAPVAAIDIGTNSIHLVVARPTENNRFEILDREKEVVRLGSGSGDMKYLEAEAVERGVEVLARFRRIADSLGAEVHAVATSAVREANNRDLFLDAAAEAGVRVEVISGMEEARLIHLGVLQSVAVFDQQILVVDIGGGSTEFVVGRGGEMLEGRSLKLGAIRLTDRFFSREPVKKAALEEARTYIRSYLPPVKRMVAAAGGFEVAVGSSGTILNVAEMVRARHGDARPPETGSAGFSADELAEVVDDLASRRRVKDRLAVPGLDARRADIILGGVLVLDQAFRVLGIEAMICSDFALREGVLLDVMRERRAGALGHLRDLRYESVLHLASLTPEERVHSDRMAGLALALFDGTRRLHGLAGEAKEWLHAAGLLCNVGVVISHARHHLHSYYVIRNSDLMTGFTEHEIELIALVARYHRKSTPKARHPEFAALRPEDQHIVRVLAGLLRVAVALDRTRTGVVTGVVVTGGGKRQPLRIGVEAPSGADVELELYLARSRCDLLAEALGVDVDIEPEIEVA